MEHFILCKDPCINTNDDVTVANCILTCEEVIVQAIHEWFSNAKRVSDLGLKAKIAQSGGSTPMSMENHMMKGAVALKAIALTLVVNTTFSAQIILEPGETMLQCSERWCKGHTTQIDDWHASGTCAEWVFWPWRLKVFEGGSFRAKSLLVGPLLYFLSSPSSSPLVNPQELPVLDMLWHGQTLHAAAEAQSSHGLVNALQRLSQHVDSTQLKLSATGGMQTIQSICNNLQHGLCQSTAAPRSRPIVWVHGKDADSFLRAILPKIDLEIDLVLYSDAVFPAEYVRCSEHHSIEFAWQGSDQEVADAVERYHRKINGWEKLGMAQRWPDGRLTFMPVVPASAEEKFQRSDFAQEFGAFFPGIADPKAIVDACFAVEHPYQRNQCLQSRLIPELKDDETAEHPDNFLCISDLPALLDDHKLQTVYVHHFVPSGTSFTGKLPKKVRASRLGFRGHLQKSSSRTAG